MPLLPPVLVDGILRVDEPSPPNTPPEAAQRWFDAWWPYFSGMSFLNPATLVAAKTLAQKVYVPILTPGCVPNPVPITFFLALEGASRAAIAALGTPAMLLPAFASVVPAPAPLAPLLLAVVPVGLVSPVKAPPRILMASIIDGWTRLNLVQPVASSPPVPFT